MNLTSIIPQFGTFAGTMLAFVVALSIIVAVHEYGHYIVGRWTGIAADIFSLGFGPVIWSRTDRRGTRWQVAALPFGGFVKFRGDADAASGIDGDAMGSMSVEERRHTMHGAPLWARSATVLAGPVFNFILTILIFTGFFMIRGVATDQAVVEVLKPTPYEGQSLLPGDRIVGLDGTDTPDLASFLKASEALPPASSATYRVERGDSAQDVSGPYPFPPLAGSVQPASAAARAGLEQGDVILTVAGKPVYAFGQLRDLVGASDGKPLPMSVWRGGTVFDAVLTPKRMDIPSPDGGFETRWLIGLTGDIVFEPETRTPGPLEAVGLAGSQTWSIVRTSLSGLGHMISGAISSCNLRGPLGIAESSGAAASQGGTSFILFIAMLSTAVGLMNLFPVPVLDGGHLLFHAFEAITGRPPSDRALRVLMGGGLALLLALMVFALSNDLFC